MVYLWVYGTIVNHQIVRKKMIKTTPSEPVVLSRYLAMCGISSRKKATELIKQGVITINHHPETDPAYRIQSNDTVRYNKKILKPEHKVYVLLNKPKGCITTMDDPQKRRTVMDHIKPKPKQQIFPVGRLDFNTTGLLLLTNDGELAQGLSHPKKGISKTYHAMLSREFDLKDLKRLAKGVKLEDGKITPDKVYYPSPRSKLLVGIQLHSGKNRIVRRLFQHLGYFIKKLDRVGYAGLTKRSLPIPEWRFLNDREVAKLKKLVS